jgi:hypothetical protein
MGFLQVPPGAPVVACECSESAAPPLALHAMVCKSIKNLTLRHDLPLRLGAASPAMLVIPLRWSQLWSCFVWVRGADAGEGEPAG